MRSKCNTTPPPRRRAPHRSPDPSTGGYIPGEVYLHSFFAYFPATDPRFIVFLYAYKPVGQEYAADTLAMPFYGIAQYLINYYNIPPDR